MQRMQLAKAETMVTNNSYQHVINILVRIKNKTTTSQQIALIVQKRIIES